MHFLPFYFHGHPTPVCVLLGIFTILATAFSFSFSLPRTSFNMQLDFLLLFAFLSLLSPYKSVAASSQIYTLHVQEEPSIAKPFIYETIVASSPLHVQEEPSIAKPFIYETIVASSPPGSLLLHANFPQKKLEALLLDDGQHHASKEKAPMIYNPSFIYESIAASFSSRQPHADGGSHLHDNSLLQDAEATFPDDGGKHFPSIAKKSFIYESVAAPLSRKVAHASTLLRESVPQEENVFLLDDVIGKPLMKKEVAKPSYTYETVIAASNPSRPPSDGRILRDNNMPQEENAFLLDDGTINPTMQKKEDPIIARPSFIYESVAASLHPEVSDVIRTNVPQEKNGFLLDDGGKHVDGVEKEAKPIFTGKPFIYEYVAALVSHISAHGAAGGSRLHDNVSQQENSSLLDDDDDGKHGLKKVEEPIKAKLSPTGSSRGSLLRENVPQPDNVLLLDNGGKHVHERSAADEASTEGGGKLLQDNVPQEKYTFLLDDRLQKPISSNHHDANNKALLTDTKPKEVKSQSLHADIDVKKSLNVQENKWPAKAPASLLHDNVPQGKHAFLVDDGGIKHVEHDSSVASSKEVLDVLLHDIVAQEKHGSLVHDGGKPAQHKKSFQSAKEEEHVLNDNAWQGEYSSLRLLDHGGRKELLKDKDDNIKNHKKLPIYHKLRLGKRNFNEENLRMVVDDSSKNMQLEKGPQPTTQADDGKCNEENIRTVERNLPNEESLRMVVGEISSNSMIRTGYKVQGNPSNEENLRMVVGDSSKSMVQEEGYGNNGELEDNLRMVVDDTSNNMKKKEPLATRSRSRSCTSNPNVCSQLAHAEHMNHIALYGRQPPRLTQAEKKPACCGGVCVDLNNNHLNCGRCGKACGLSQTCCNGKCTDLTKDNFNCGQCGHSCPSFSPCQYGMCGYY